MNPYEQYAASLSQCDRSMADLRAWYGRRPIYAECGGMLLLGQTLTDLEGQAHPMTGLLPFHAKKGSLQVGYRSLDGTEDSLVVRKGDRLMGHEFHRWELHPTGPNDGLNNLLDRPHKIKHLHWASCSMISRRWRAALEPQSIPATSDF